VLQNSVENGEDPGDGLELRVPRDVGLDEKLNHGAPREEEVGH